MSSSQRKSLELGLKVHALDLYDWTREIVVRDWKLESMKDEEQLDKLIKNFIFSVLPPLANPGEAVELDLVSSIYLVKLSSLSQFGYLPKFEELQARGLLEVHCPMFEMPPFTFISHKWYKPGSPDSDFRRKHHYLVDIASKEKVEYVWIDYCCIPQEAGDRAIAEEIEKLDHLLHLTSKVISIAFDDAMYRRSGWCMVEALVGNVNKVRVLQESDGSVEEQDYYLEVEKLTFGVEEDAPTVFIKALNYVYQETDIRKRRKVCESIRMTLNAKNFESFNCDVFLTLMTKYKQKLTDIMFQIKQSIGTDNVEALMSLSTTLKVRRNLIMAERAAFQTIMRTDFCKFAYPIPGVKIIDDPIPDPSIMVQQMDLPDPLGTRNDPQTNTVEEIQFTNDPVNTFMSQLVPQSIQSSPYNNMLNLCDHNCFATLQETIAMLHELGFRSVGMDRWEELIMGVWTDQAGDDDDEYSFRSRVAEAKGSIFKILIKSTEENLPRPVNCRKRVLPLSRMDMHTKPYLVWHDCETEDEAMDLIKRAPHVRTFCLNNRGRSQNFNLMSINTLIPIFADPHMPGWVRFNTMLAASYGLKMSTAGLEKTRPNDPHLRLKVLLWIMINWINPHDGIKRDIVKIQEKIGKVNDDSYVASFNGCVGVLDCWASMAYISEICHQMTTRGKSLEDAAEMLKEPLYKWIKGYIVPSAKKSLLRQRKLLIPSRAMKHIQLITRAKVAADGPNVEPHLLAGFAAHLASAREGQPRSVSPVGSRVSRRPETDDVGEETPQLSSAEALFAAMLLQGMQS